ncbi:MAG: T9SS type A sorting domain-containing protein [Candidatus Marinimicrobia bacterium]|nr:T9SS type A sorting domain-containing protein [Candidatus Neomarinimicrobiota bacterium]
MKKIILATTALILLSVGLRAASLSGQVYDNDTNIGIPEAFVQLMNQDWDPIDSTESMYFAMCDNEGYYEIDSLSEGTYFFQVWSLLGYQSHFDIISIAGDLIINVPLSPLPGAGTITGLVYSDVTGAPLADYYLELIPLSENGIWVQTTTGTDGTFTASAPEGQYIVGCWQLSTDFMGWEGDSLFIIEYFEFFDDVQSIDLATFVNVIEGETIAGIDFGMPPEITTGDLSHFTEILNGHYLDYLDFNSETGLGIINYIIIESIEAGDIGDEIGILDSYGIPGLGNCEDSEQGEVLVGAGVWNGESLMIPIFGSVADCENSNIEYPGFIEGNPIELVLWDASENTEYFVEAEFSFGSPTPNVNGVLDPSIYGNHYTFANLLGIITSQDSWNIPDGFVINGNYPNPFNPTTTISYDLPEQSVVNLTIYDVRGQEVMTLQDAPQPAGNYHVQWNGIDQAGNQVSTGLYFCRLSAGSFSKTIKMLFLQ